MSKRKGIFFTTISLSLLTFFIKALGFIKQAVIAATYGANYETDAFFLSTGLSTNLATIVFSAISIVLLSQYSNKLAKNGKDAASELINACLKVFIPIAILIAVFFYLGSPFIAKILAPSYSSDQLDVMTHYLRLMSPTFVFWAYSLIMNVVQEGNMRFFPGKGYAFFQNAFLIIAAFMFAGSDSIESLVIAFVVAGVAQCILITFCSFRYFSFSNTSLRKYHADIKQLLVAILPLLVGNAIYEINDIVDKKISTGLGEGSASYLSYGGSVNELVTTLLISVVTTVMYAHYTEWVAKGEIEKVSQNLTSSIKALMVIVLPISALVVVSGTSIIDLLYGRGQFDDAAIQSTYSVVTGYAIGFLFQAVRANLVKIYYAFQDTKTPMINGAISVAVNIVLSVTLSRIWGVGAVALATSIAMLLVSVLLLTQIKKYLPDFSVKLMVGEFFKAVIATVMVVVVLLGIHTVIIMESSLLQCILDGILTVCVYVVMMIILKSETLTVLLKKVKVYH